MPTIEGKACFGLMHEKALKWLDTAQTGKLHRRMFWFSVERQFWTSVGFGLGSNMGSLQELEIALNNKNFYGKMMPLGGFVRAASELNVTPAAVG